MIQRDTFTSVLRLGASFSEKCLARCQEKQLHNSSSAEQPVRLCWWISFEKRRRRFTILRPRSGRSESSPGWSSAESGESCNHIIKSAERDDRGIILKTHPLSPARAGWNLWRLPPRIPLTLHPGLYSDRPLRGRRWAHLTARATDEKGIQTHRLLVYRTTHSDFSESD